MPFNGREGARNYHQRLQTESEHVLQDIADLLHPAAQRELEKAAAAFRRWLEVRLTVLQLRHRFLRVRPELHEEPGCPLGTQMVTLNGRSGLFGLWGALRERESRHPVLQVIAPEILPIGGSDIALPMPPAPHPEEHRITNLGLNPVQAAACHLGDPLIFAGEEDGLPPGQNITLQAPRSFLGFMGRHPLSPHVIPFGMPPNRGVLVHEFQKPPKT